ncbi:lipopolysaccharide heptosyltransferase family protein [Fusobacterium nucleatum subsp. nucleatum ATCC 25586]|uniref:LOS biosynthesis enzyme LBGB n=1 Tax=Fusobacterium nucleatum subsp. nucleatum (strain ATCC 25586 / DSM 15643 / BCRC 10681 / CIP 101130 / JCM 8532 / KCTC 2640 / LMG 13131 / VPI 4355) TaxID=190304 RepID=Q8RE75_FUSNN|nr:glycosyltransferase family 9 protein [Fusobacterium nucleatum]AAL95443.1 LOS biosynthesis enzyme LBGB [Fusobacterium nucleatum subsp. nucleatum ATCC 25586]AVQ15578.1 lipopolysaccharide heptosyltransferase family protein [Fusobacterium nucleatum subsp. nucleatum ATCC 25586]WMS28591.1 glycosyltransferase family 9 protein [Fusobacterium nucleatum]
MKNLIKKLNRIFQDYMREKRLKIGKYIWDRKDRVKILEGNSFLEDNDIKSILFLRYDGKIGDMVVNSLMFREIKKVYPNIKIGVVARGAAMDIIKDNPNIDKIYEYHKDRKKIKDLALKIKEEKYDLLIDFSEMLRVNQMMLINLCGARFNIGLNRKEWKLFDLSIESDKDFKWTEHITNRYLAYLVKLGLKKENIDISYDIYLKDEKKYEFFFNEIKENKKLILNPYGASKHKSFTIETLENIITCLKDKDIAIILVYFGDKYKELEFLEKKYNNIYMPQKIESILDTTILIKKSDYVISPDTSIVHIASALNKKMITVYPPNGGKYGVDHLVWAPKSEYSRVIFCKDKTGTYDEIDINTFNFDEIKEEILKLINNSD